MVMRSNPIVNEVADQYLRILDQLFKDADNYDREALQWEGHFRLGCALNGLDLVPYDLVEHDHRPVYWQSVTIRDVTYWVVEISHYR